MEKTGFDWLLQILQFLQSNFANIASIFSLFLVTFGPILGPPVKKYLTKTADKFLNRDEYNKNLQKIETQNEKTNSESDEIQARAAKTNVETAMSLLEKQRQEFDKERIFFMQKLAEMEENIRVNGGISAEINNKYRAILSENEEIRNTNKNIEDKNLILSQNNTEIKEKLELIQKENEIIKIENQKTKNESLELHKENRQLKKTIGKMKTIILELRDLVKKWMKGITQLIDAYKRDHLGKEIPWYPVLSKEEEILLNSNLDEVEYNP